MEYKIGQLAAFLNTNSEEKSIDEEVNVNKKKKKKSKKKRFSDETDQSNRTFETENENSLSLQSSSQLVEVESNIRDEHSQQEKVTYKKKSNKKKRKEDQNNVNCETETFNVNSELTEEGDEMYLKKFKKEKKFLHFEERDENSDDLTKQNSTNKKKKYQKTSVDYDKDKRTVFVGNLPVTFEKEKIKTIFKSFGAIESIRIRSAAPIKSTLPKRVAVIKNLYHPEISSYNAYVVFKTEQTAQDSLKLNGTKIQENHIRVDRIIENQQHDYKKSIFVGNLPYNITDEELWDFFLTCGEITNVRVIRDKSTRIGKGFGYVLFKTIDSSNRAIKMDGKELKERPLRISRAKNENKTSQRNKTFGQKRERNWKFQGMTAMEKQKIKKKKKMIKLRLERKQKKQIARKLQSRNKMS